MYELNCYRCGEPGHIKAHCPDAEKSPPPPPEGAAVHTYQPPPPPAPRPASERAWYDEHHPAAEWVREVMGWGTSEERSRERARKQVQEMRDIRRVMGLTRGLSRHNFPLMRTCRPHGIVCTMDTVSARGKGTGHDLPSHLRPGTTHQSTRA